MVSAAWDRVRWRLCVVGDTPLNLGYVLVFGLNWTWVQVFIACRSLHLLEIIDACPWTCLCIWSSGMKSGRVSYGMVCKASPCLFFFFSRCKSK